MPEEEALVEVTTTLDDRAAAMGLAKQLVEKRLAACVQVNAVDSTYRWEGRLTVSAEHLLRAKTRAGGVDALIAFLENAHPYDLPEITVKAIGHASEAYAGWVVEETS